MSKRGALLPVAQLINLSHPPAMPNLGTAAPKVVVKDAKGDANKPTQWSERAPRIQREVLVQPKIPEKDAKGFASAKGAGRGKAKPVPTAADVSSARMLTMLDVAAAKAAKPASAPTVKLTKTPMTVAELEAQMVKMMSAPPPPAGAPPNIEGLKKLVGVKKQPVSVKDLEQSLLSRAQPPLPPTAAPNVPSATNEPRKPRTKKPVAPPLPSDPPPPPMPSAALLAASASAAPPASAAPAKDAAPDTTEPKPAAPQRMVPRNALLRAGASKK